MVVPPAAPAQGGTPNLAFASTQSSPMAGPSTTPLAASTAAKTKPAMQSAPGTLNGPPSGNNHAIPLSARRAEPLDLSTVERRGQLNAAQRSLPMRASAEHQTKRSRPYDIPDAPIFRPTDEEFRDPMEYIRKIAPTGSKYGIVKIVPPDNWNPTFAINTEVRSYATMS